MSLARNLLIFAYDFPPSSGGISRLCYEIAIGQANNFDEVVVLTRKKVGDYQPEKQANFRLIELPRQRLECEIQAIKALRQFDKKKTTILCGLWYPEAFLAMCSGHRNVYVLAHGAELQAGNSRFRKYVWHKLFAKAILQNVKKVISNSHYTKTLVQTVSKKSNCSALPLGVDIHQFKPCTLSKNSENRFIIGSLSRLHKFKGYDQVLDALQKLPISVQEGVIWRIGGTGPYLEDLRCRIEKLAPKFKVEFLGFIPDEDLVRFYNGLQLFILFTQNNPLDCHVEGFGLVFLEAQACGVPTIGTNTGGIPDAIERNNGGWLFEQNDIDGLASQIKVLFEDDALLRRQSVLARRRSVEKASWQSYNLVLNQLMQ